MESLESLCIHQIIGLRSREYCLELRWTLDFWGLLPILFSEGLKWAWKWNMFQSGGLYYLHSGSCVFMHTQTSKVHCPPLSTNTPKLSILEFEPGLPRALYDTSTIKKSDIKVQKVVSQSFQSNFRPLSELPRTRSNLLPGLMSWV